MRGADADSDCPQGISHPSALLWQHNMLCGDLDQETPLAANLSLSCQYASPVFLAMWFAKSSAGTKVKQKLVT